MAQARTAEMAFQDEFDGLPNRRDFLQKLEAACRDTDRYPFGCLMFDLDRFKQSTIRIATSSAIGFSRL